jgi:hypothetical protein
MSSKRSKCVEVYLNEPEDALPNGILTELRLGGQRHVVDCVLHSLSPLVYSRGYDAFENTMPRSVRYRVPCQPQQDFHYTQQQTASFARTIFYVTEAVQT